MEYGRRLISELKEPGEALPSLNKIRKLDHALTSLKELESLFKEHVQEQKWVYDPQVKAYVPKA
jgi:hypothetical protein